MTGKGKLPREYLVTGPIGAHDATFRQDRDHFRKTRLRTAIRVAKPYELEDPEPGAPILWVLVTAVSPALHVVVPIWRGNEFIGLTGTGYFPAKSDAEIAAVAQACLSRATFFYDDWAA